MAVTTEQPEYFAEPDPATQEMTAAHARSYAAGVPHPKGAAAAADPPAIPLAPAKRVQAQFNPLADGMIYLVVFVGGCVGTAMRYALSLLLPAPAAAHGFFSAFHTATFLANMIACLIFAFVSTYMSQAAWIRKRVRQLASRGIGMGMCGGFSTLSAMVIEELTSIHADQIGGFLFYMFASFAGGLIVAATGVRLALAASSRRSARVVADALAAASGAAGPAHAAPKRDVDDVALADKPIMVGVSDDSGVPGDSGDGSAIPSFEPAPITDEIPMVGDPVTGDAHGEATR
ncbi:fluoride efflux transporter FluC [Bifidobacterium stellenboschense]|uniref:Fluoride-specific ion channel FluC n=1 Tax=Bifidobacterium stellenboschense TaxID=762211 RepID=A0A087DMU2_9BIFI|nr:CrcB family protein [Bifidobacterium stellenboschense]KFI96842.1 camphor resistance protein CrcB [Bifidobacterium stellenboschense]